MQVNFKCTKFANNPKKLTLLKLNHDVNYLCGKIEPPNPSTICHIFFSCGQFNNHTEAYLLHQSISWNHGIMVVVVLQIRQKDGIGESGKHGLRDEHAAGKTGTAYNFTDHWFIGYWEDRISRLLDGWMIGLERGLEWEYLV